MERLHCRKLLIRPKPKTDESLLGFIVRLTEANDYDSPSWITQVAKLGYMGHKCSFVLDDNVDLVPLACLSGRSTTELQSLSYPSVDGSGAKYATRHFFGLPVPPYVIRVWDPKICPACLEESGYCRRIWDLTPVTVCPTHRCILVDRCPKCKRQIGWVRNSVSRCPHPCGYYWSDSQLQMVDDIELEVVRHIHRLCNLAVGNVSGNGLLTRTPLARLKLEHLLSALFFIASQLAGVAHRKGQRTIDTKGKTFAPSRRNAEIHALLCKALLVFDNWPHNYYSFLDWRRAQKDISEYARAHRNYFAEYKSALFVQLASSDLEFMRSAFREYRRIRHYESYVRSDGYAVNITARKEDESPFFTKAIGVSISGQAEVEISKLYETHVSGIKAVKALNTTWPSLEGLIASGRLKAIIGNKGGKRLFLVEKVSLDELKEKLERSVFLRQVEQLLGVHFERVKELIECGLLNPLRGPNIDKYGEWRFDPKEIKDLVDRLFKGLTTKSRHNKQKILSFKLVLRKVGQVGVNLGTFLQDVLVGEIKPCGRSKEAGLCGLLFWERQITDYMRSELRLLIGDALSIPEIARLLGVTRTAVDFFVKKNLLHAEKFAGAQSFGLLVMREELDSFSEKYVLAREVATKHGTSTAYIIDLLSKKGVKPISGPKIDGGRVYLIEKRDVESLSLATLISEEKKKQTVPRRPSAPKVASRLKGSKRVSKSKSSHILPKASQWWVLDEGQTAEMLEMDIQSVRQLAARGALQPHKRLSGDKHKGEEYWFSRYIVQKYKSRSVNHTGLIAYTAAAKLFDLWPANFNNRFVKTGRLMPVIANGRRSNYFFRVEDVEALVEIEKQTIITPEAAEILGVNVSCVNKMIASGVLNPISGPTIDSFGKNLFLRSNVEKLHAEREAFKAKRVKEGGTARFGR